MSTSRLPAAAAPAVVVNAALFRLAEGEKWDDKAEAAAAAAAAVFELEEEEEELGDETTAVGGGGLEKKGRHLRESLTSKPLPLRTISAGFPSC
jgi:hypothetical protein